MILPLSEIKCRSEAAEYKKYKAVGKHDMFFYSVLKLLVRKYHLLSRGSKQYIANFSLQLIRQYDRTECALLTEEPRERIKASAAGS